MVEMKALNDELGINIISSNAFISGSGGHSGPGQL